MVYSVSLMKAPIARVGHKASSHAPSDIQSQAQHARVMPVYQLTPAEIRKVVEDVLG
jgi:hypothetical protein